MESPDIYDVGIVGGGLAGLTLAIQCSRAGNTVVLIEKETYPFHRVCGEYISNESRPFLKSLGLPLSEMDLPEMQRIVITDSAGIKISQELPLGGFGISRYYLDHVIFMLAEKAGAKVLTGQKVDDVQFGNDLFSIHTKAKKIIARVVAGCFGKRSNVDVRWNRNFISQKFGPLNNLIGVKYHVTANWKKDIIALHHFQNGYCGISAVEDNKFCVCYLTNARNLQECGSIEKLEETFLKENISLRSLLNEAETIAGPFTISQISFANKSKIENHVLMLGDAAGMITPLCGNGMSMAMHSSKIAFSEIDKFLKKEISRHQMEMNYAANWERQFSSRIRAGKIVQRLFESKHTAHFILSILRHFPWLLTAIIKRTHGKAF